MYFLKKICNIPLAGLREDQLNKKVTKASEYYNKTVRPHMFLLLQF